MATALSVFVGAYRLRSGYHARAEAALPAAFLAAFALTGQHASGTASEMLQQAKTLFGLYPDSDLDYLERRIREETMGEYGVEDCKG